MKLHVLSSCLMYQNVKINIDKTIIRPAGFYGCETDTQ